VDKLVIKPLLSTDFGDFGPKLAKILGKPGENSAGSCAQLGKPMWIKTDL
jgi:hypothetical protein